MIEFGENAYIVGMWYAHDPKTENNWMCCVQRDPKTPKRFKGDEIKGDVSKFLELAPTKKWLHMKCEPMEKKK